MCYCVCGVLVVSWCLYVSYPFKLSLKKTNIGNIPFQRMFKIVETLFLESYASLFLLLFENHIHIFATHAYGKY